MSDPIVIPDSKFGSPLSLQIIIIWIGKFQSFASLEIDREFKDFSLTSRAPECYRILVFTASDLRPKTPKTWTKSSIFDTFLSVLNLRQGFVQILLEKCLKQPAVRGNDLEIQS